MSQTMRPKGTWALEMGSAYLGRVELDAEHEQQKHHSELRQRLNLLHRYAHNLDKTNFLFLFSFCFGYSLVSQRRIPKQNSKESLCQLSEQPPDTMADVLDDWYDRSCQSKMTRRPTQPLMIIGRGNTYPCRGSNSRSR